MKRKIKRKAVRNPITGEIEYYTNTKTVGLRDPFTGKIVKRISKTEAEKRVIATRIYTLGDAIEDMLKKGKKRKKSWPF